MTCKWTYYKMVSQGVYDATKYTIKYTHTAGGGDLYPST